MCLVKCRNFVECVVWWLMWVMFVVFVVCRWQCRCCEEFLCLVCACEWWSEVYFDGSSVFVKVWVGCSVG